MKGEGKKRIIVLLMFILAVSLGTYSQVIPVKDQEHFTDSIKKEMDFGPYFGLYKDNYFVVGTTVPGIPSKNNSDVKFQISLAIRLTDMILPWHSFLFLTYTQKTFWNVFQESMPMGDINFNPGIGWSKPFFNHNRYVGKMTLMLEHESNGRDGIDSRSWNRVSLSGSVMIDEWLMVHAKIWIPIIDGENNRDILKYNGIYQSGVVLTTPDKKFSFGLTWVKRYGFNLNFNTIAEFSWRVHKKSNLNLFAQYYNGYGEDLLHYNQYRSMLRIGLVFKPKFFSEF
ncbi:MAG: phospholipase A [Muribaculaceae bacterium]|nr:phospholipase A [Muribaculaceae bacterium]